MSIAARICGMDYGKFVHLRAGILGTKAQSLLLPGLRAGGNEGEQTIPRKKAGRKGISAVGIAAWEILRFAQNDKIKDFAVETF